MSGRELSTSVCRVVRSFEPPRHYPTRELAWSESTYGCIKVRVREYIMLLRTDPTCVLNVLHARLQCT
jgi:hypothetical protein